MIEKEKRNNLLMQLAGIAILIVLWEGLVIVLQIPEYIFPRFSVLIVEFCKFPKFFLLVRTSRTLGQQAGPRVQA